MERELFIPINLESSACYVNRAKVLKILCRRGLTKFGVPDRIVQKGGQREDVVFPGLLSTFTGLS